MKLSNNNSNIENEEDEEMTVLKKGVIDSSDDSSDSDDEGSSDDDDDDNMESKTDYENSSEGLEVGLHEIKLREDPYNYDKNLIYINALAKFTKPSNYKTLREAREKFQSIFPLSQDIWLTWLNDEEKLMKSDQDKQYIQSLYEKALNDFISVKICISYCKFKIKISTVSGLIKHVEEIRCLFERVLVLCGYDLIESPMLWAEYRMFEQIVLSQQEGQDEKDKQIQIIRELYKRQLSIPMIGLESIYNDYKQWEESQTDASGNGSNASSAVDIKFKQTLKSLNDRLPFETSLKEKKYMDLKKWKEYIDFEKLQAQKGVESGNSERRIITLYERELKYYPNNYSVWSLYLYYLECTLKDSRLHLNTFKRSLRSIYYSGEHWSKYLLLLQHSNCEQSEFDQEFQRSLLSGLKSEMDYQLVYNTYIDYYWRLVKSGATTGEDGAMVISEESKSYIKSLFESMNNYMASIDVNNYTTVERYMYIAQFEWRQFADTQRYREIVDYILTSVDSSHVWIWDQYIAFEMEQKQYDSVRSLYQKATSVIKFDNPLSRLWQEWFTFERGYGTLDQYQSVYDQYSKLQYRQQLQHLQHQHQHNQEKQHSNKRKEKDNPTQDDKGDGNKKELKKQKKDKPTNGSGKVEKQQDQQQQPQQVVEQSPQPQQVEFKKPLPKKEKEKEKEKEEKDLPKKLIVLNLPFDIDEEALHKIFEVYGEIKSLKIVNDKNGKSKGIAFILFNDNSQATKALEMDEKQIKNRTVKVQFAKEQVPQDNNGEQHGEHMDTSTGGSTSTTTNEIDFNNHVGLTVFINNLSPGVNKERLEQFFTSNGVTGIKDVRLVLKARPFAYIDLIDKDNLKKALSLDKKYFMSKSINVNLSKPPANSLAPSATTTTTTPVEEIEIPTRKPTLLVPRGVKKK